MRVMLGKDDEPSLLVDVESGNYPTEFKFWVVNGAWYGSFINGMVIVDHYLHHLLIHHYQYLYLLTY